MAEEIPFDEVRDHRRYTDAQDHEVSDDDLQVQQKINNEQNAVKKSYLGTRRDRSGKWVRRHCSEKRYPRMAGKSSNVSSPPTPTATDREPNNEFTRQVQHREQGRSGSPRQKRRNIHRRLKREQQQMQQNMHIGYERRTHGEENHLRIENKDFYDNRNWRLAQDNTVLPPNTIKSSQAIATSNLAEQSNASGRRYSKQKKHKLIFDVSSMQKNKMETNTSTSKIDEISGLFTTSSKITSATKHSDIDNNDEERIRRFGAAYNAIMLAHQVHEVKPPEPRPTYSGKRWARDPKIISAMSIDGRSYSDLQRTPTLSLKQMMTTPDVYDSKTGMLNVELHDRKASWLVHMPRNSSKCSGEEKHLSEIKEECATDIKDFNTSIRDRDRVTVIEDSSTLTPCLRKLNDIETSMQSVEKGLKFDLEENRRAVVRHQLNAQRSGKIASSVQKRFKQFTIHEKSTAENHLSSTEFESGINNNDNDNNSGIDSTPIVNTSALRRLFSGKTEDNQTESSDYDPSTLKFESNEIMPHMSKKSSIQIPSNSSPFNRIEESENGNEECVPTNHHISLTSEDDVVAVTSAKSQPHDQESLPPKPPLDNNQNSYDLEQQVIDENIDLSIYRPDPPASANPEPKDVSLSQPQLNVANLVRASLVIHARSYIDTDENLDDFDDEEEQTITRSMLMSPSLITKRYQQVLKAIEAKNWEQVSYLTHANPWLMEMKDVRNDQYLIHSLALYSGGGQTDVDTSADQLSIQKEIVFNILDYEPGVVHKLDTEGYLPLHMAAASGNTMMIKILGEKFPAAASVQNHDGLLPLHLAVMSCALYATGEHAVDLILNLFPTGIVVKDCDGNTPLHTAAGALRAHVGVSIISRLLQVHEDILTSNPSFIKETMGEPKVPKNFDEITVATLDDAGDDLSNGLLPMMKNKVGETPLVRAIKSKAGRQVIDILLAADGGSLAALDENAAGATALHLILRNEFYDPGAAISVLKSAPTAAAIRDVKRTLPIQLACSNLLQREIILAIAIVDLPIDLGAKEEVIHRNGFGASWWFLLCESNDQFVDIVAEILALCSHQQKLALCLTSVEGREDDTAIAFATPQCKATLRKALRFLGRFEFTGAPQTSPSREVHKFDALDYGSNASNEAKKVILVCFGNNDVYAREAKHLNESKLDFKFYEELQYFAIEGEDVANIPSGVKLRHCVAVAKSKLSLSRVVAGMPRNHGYRADLNLLRKYYGKVKSILFRVGEGICKLHASNIIHGQIDSRNIMKFGDKWKITGLCGSVVRGGLFPKTRIGSHSPPELLVVQLNKSAPTSKKPANFVAHPSIDVWAFGKLMFETFVGESTFASFVENDDEELDFAFIAGWSNRHIDVVTKLLSESGIGDLGLDLVRSCLQLEPSRSQSMTKILRHDFWKEKY